ncbi:insulin-like growth factor-binding protein complex acid labile subunit [Strongylocentrotus purpuratus]|uniref:Uncharacterized protein n=1 Tax=Strongylocentrotus purpuratus TaxID=7668 RepID=A0A7M7HRC0_STRPU|nr:insulin-like growth factor-binding protein complex acid labile subunit [Strongylocentrotus purpuratus]
MTISRLTSGLKSPWRVLLFVFPWTACLLTLALQEHSVGYTREMEPNKCRLENKTDGIKAFCSNLRLKSIPQDLPPNTTTLIASHNIMQLLQNDSFENLTRLVSLNVGSNQISHLDSRTFLPLSDLRVLNMAKNRLTHLTDDVFDSNPLLSLLILSSNCFSSVPSGALATLHQLQMVSLDHNNIQKVDFTAFRHLNNISVIDLSRNIISSLLASDFEPLQNSSLDSIKLAYNMVRSLPFGTFSFLHRVSTLDLQQNAFLEFNVNSFLGSVIISELSVSYCKIGRIVPLKATSLHNKTTLSIDSVEMDGNEICSIPDYAFRGFSQTRTLNIIKNKVTTMTNGSFCGLDSLENLDISENHINSLPSGLFRCNPRLLVLNIARNEILVVNPVAFCGLSVLLKLDLSHNFIGRMDTHHWNNTALRVLDISHNQYTYINKKISSFGV